MKARVPCRTSTHSPIDFSRSSYGLPIPICYSPYGKAIEETLHLAILFPAFFAFFSGVSARAYNFPSPLADAKRGMS